MGFIDCVAGAVQGRRDERASMCPLRALSLSRKTRRTLQDKEEETRTVRVLSGPASCQGSNSDTRLPHVISHVPCIIHTTSREVRFLRYTLAFVLGRMSSTMADSCCFVPRLFLGYTHARSIFPPRTRDRRCS